MSAKRKVRARRMWEHPSGRVIERPHSCGNPVFVLPADAKSYDAIRESFAEEAAIALATAFFRGQLNTAVVTEKREDYQLADTLLKRLNIHRSPTKEQSK